MTLEFALPSHFVEVHREQLNQWMGMCPFPEHWRIAMREPLGLMSDSPVSELAVSVPILRATQHGSRLLVAPADVGSAEIIADWAKRHERTTREDFDWLPDLC